MHREIDDKEDQKIRRKKEVIHREVEEALGVTDIEIEINEEQRLAVEKQVDRSLEMDIDKQGLEE
jgi:hypothetical protein